MVSFCELCGKQTDINKKVMVERTIFNVCLSCSKRGKSVESSKVSKPSGSFKGTITGGNLSTNTTSSTVGSKNLYARKIRSAPRIKPLPQRKINLVDEMILDQEFPSIIRNARGKKGLTHEQLGQKINEKVTLIKKIETGSMRPDDILAKKLERFLGVNLYINSNDEDFE